MVSHNFSTKLADISISLETASDVVRFSFIVQDSLSHLDLQVSNIPNTKFYCCAYCKNCKPGPLTSFMNTEEKCRKFFAPMRTLLYSLHLDLPTGRENSLRIDAQKSVYCCFRCCWSPVVDEIDTISYALILSSFIEDALVANVPKMEILKWVLKASFQGDPILSDLDIQTANKFIDCFYPVMTDSLLFEDFIKQFDIHKWMVEFENPEILEFLLYYKRLLGNVHMLTRELSVEFISNCILGEGYQSVGPILKCIGDSEPTYLDYDEYVSDIQEQRPRLTADIIDKTEKSKTWERICRMAQIIWIFLNIQSPDLPPGIREDASEALRLVWSSIPDPCITLHELAEVFEAAFSEEELKNVFDFYARAVGESHECVEPRSFKHLCRTASRRAFQKNNLWIPDAVSQAGLPKSLQSFLNLEKKFAV